MDPDFGPFGGFDQTFQAMQGMFFVVFALAIAVMVLQFVRGISRTAKDNAAPEVTAAAAIVDKRVAVTGGGRTSSAGMLQADGSFGPAVSHSTPIRETYYVTFQQSGGERFELEVPEAEFGLLVVGDQGSVTMKGTRYLGFARELLR